MACGLDQAASRPGTLPGRGRGPMEAKARLLACCVGVADMCAVAWSQAASKWTALGPRGASSVRVRVRLPCPPPSKAFLAAARRLCRWGFCDGPSAVMRPRLPHGTFLLPHEAKATSRYLLLPMRPHNCLLRP
eukprot:363433-Chlamydomonas_euryale.AAC.13